jgi:hypothetical protein
MAKRRHFKVKKSKMSVKNKFKNAMFKLRRMGKRKQQNVIAGASKEFIKDISDYLSKIRRKPHLVKNWKHRKQLKRHRVKLQRLVNPQVSLDKKRKILLMRGGIFPFVIPIICASIGAAGTVGAAAVGAAIAKA